ncbi:MAG: STAS domain-containing protein [Maricaulaceae bacterium]|jgi:chemotaxis protein CheX
MKLPPILDLNAAKALRDEFTESRGDPLKIDASEVSKLGGLCLQVLLAAQAAWKADGVEFELERPSSAFTEAARLAGASELAPEVGGA